MMSENERQAVSNISTDLGALLERNRQLEERLNALAMAVVNLQRRLEVIEGVTDEIIGEVESLAVDINAIDESRGLRHVEGGA